MSFSSSSRTDHARRLKLLLATAKSIEVEDAAEMRHREREKLLVSKVVEEVEAVVHTEVWPECAFERRREDTRNIDFDIENFETIRTDDDDGSYMYCGEHNEQEVGGDHSSQQNRQQRRLLSRRRRASSTLAREGREGATSASTSAAVASDYLFDLVASSADRTAELLADTMRLRAQLQKELESGARSEEYDGDGVIGTSRIAFQSDVTTNADYIYEDSDDEEEEEDGNTVPCDEETIAALYRQLAPTVHQVAKQRQERGRGLKKQNPPDQEHRNNNQNEEPHSIVIDASCAICYEPLVSRLTAAMTSSSSSLTSAPPPPPIRPFSSLTYRSRANSASRVRSVERPQSASSSSSPAPHAFPAFSGSGQPRPLSSSGVRSKYNAGGTNNKINSITVSNSANIANCANVLNPSPAGGGGVRVRGGGEEQVTLMIAPTPRGGNGVGSVREKKDQHANNSNNGTTHQEERSTREGPLMIIKLMCGHVFCEACLLKWLRINGSCPTCRSVVRKVDYPPPPKRIRDLLLLGLTQPCSGEHTANTVCMRARDKAADGHHQGVAAADFSSRAHAPTYSSSNHLPPRPASATLDRNAGQHRLNNSPMVSSQPNQNNFHRGVLRLGASSASAVVSSAAFSSKEGQAEEEEEVGFSPQLERPPTEQTHADVLGRIREVTGVKPLGTQTAHNNNNNNEQEGTTKDANGRREGEEDGNNHALGTCTLELRDATRTEEGKSGERLSQEEHNAKRRAVFGNAAAVISSGHTDSQQRPFHPSAHSEERTAAPITSDLISSLSLTIVGPPAVSIRSHDRIIDFIRSKSKSKSNVGPSPSSSPSSLSSYSSLRATVAATAAREAKIRQSPAASTSASRTKIELTAGVHVHVFGDPKSPSTSSSHHNITHGASSCTFSPKGNDQTEVDDCSRSVFSSSSAAPQNRHVGTMRSLLHVPPRPQSSQSSLCPFPSSTACTSTRGASSHLLRHGGGTITPIHAPPRSSISFNSSSALVMSASSGVTSASLLSGGRGRGQASITSLSLRAAVSEESTSMRAVEETSRGGKGFGGGVGGALRVREAFPSAASANTNTNTPTTLSISSGTELLHGSRRSLQRPLSAAVATSSSSRLSSSPLATRPKSATQQKLFVKYSQQQQRSASASDAGRCSTLQNDVSAGVGVGGGAGGRVGGASETRGGAVTNALVGTSTGTGSSGGGAVGALVIRRLYTPSSSSFSRTSRTVPSSLSSVPEL